MKKFLNLLLSVSMIMMCLSGLSLVAFAESVTVGEVIIEQDADGYYIIDSAEKFEAVFSKTNADNTDLLTGGNKFKQTQSFTLPKTYYPVNVNFTGTYDGGNCTITIPSDLSTPSSTNFALFRKLNGATIKNLTVDGTVTINKNYTSIFAGTVNASTDNYFTNCTNKVNLTSGTNGTEFAGFAISVSGNVTFDTCVNDGDINAKTGVAGFIYNKSNTNTIKFINCKNNGNITGTVAGTAGFMTTTKLGANNASFEGCENNGTISGTSFVAGFLAGTVAIYNPASFENCTNNGSVTGSANQVGGFVTRIDKSTFTNCINTGAITGTGDVGGFMGQSNGQFTNCTNSGKITATGSNTHAGGFIGGINGGNDDIKFTLCANRGDVVSKGKTGGFAPYIGVAANVYFDRCYNEGNINAWNMRGGFIGQPQGYSSGKTITVSVKDCYNAGYILGSNEGKGSLFGSIDSETDSAAYTIDNFYDALNPALDVIGTAKANESTTVTYNDVYILNALSTYTYGVKADEEDLKTVPEGFTSGVWAVEEETGYPYIQLVDNLYTPGNDVTAQPVKGTYVFTGTTTDNLAGVEGIEEVTTSYAIVAAKFAYNNTALLDTIKYGVFISEDVSGTDLTETTENVQIAYGNKNLGGRYGILIHGTNLQAGKTYYVRPFVTNGTKYWYGDADSFALSE